MTKIRILMLLSLLQLIGQPSAHAFTAEVHTEITHDALSERGYKKRLITKVVEANLATDEDEETVDGAHFDSEKFEEGSERLRRKLSDAVIQVIGCQRDQALESLGRGFHAIQDFFSHSNVVENDPKMRIDILHLRNPGAAVSCDPKTHLGALTSGYWPDYKRPASNKCTHSELNKDEPSAGVWHVLARERALVESRNYEDLLEQRLFDSLKYDTAFQLIEYLKGIRKDCPLEISNI